MLRRLAQFLVAVGLLQWIGSALAQDSELRGRLNLRQQGMGGPRVALVVGVGRYANAPNLPNPPRDARSIDAALRRLGFDSELVVDPDKADLERAIQRFGARSRGADAALFYYAGHAIELAGKNWLLPSTAELNDERAVRFEAVDLDAVAEQIEGRARVNLLFVDACRDNPFRLRLANQGVRAVGSGGLAQMRAPVGTLIAFATAPGNFAEDGQGDNSPFTAAMLQYLETPGLEVRQMLGRVRATVREMTNGRQLPWEHTSLEGDFFFVRQAAATLAPVAPPTPVAVTPAPVVPAAPDAGVMELAFWQSVERGNTIAEYQAYVDAYPQGRFVGLARARIAALQLAQRQLAAVPVAPVAPARTRRAVVPVVGVYPEPRAIFRDRRADGADCPECPELAVIPAGSFTLGVSDEEERRETVPDALRARARPQMEVRISRPLALGRYEVTVAEYGAFVTATNRQHPGGCQLYRPHATTRNWEWQLEPNADWRSPRFPQTDRQPVVCVNWEDAQAYVRWLSERTLHEYRLASEAEWEYAARAGTRTARWWGDRAQDACANANVLDRATSRAFNWPQPAPDVHACEDAVVHTAAIGRFRSNEFALHDMLGNVWEWTADCWNANYAGRPIDERAWEVGDCSQRVVRGGSWVSNAWAVRSGSRSRINASDRYFFVGIRVARTLNP
jgi:formylglycine-generating enzyme required for sulfatase activity